MSAKIKPLELDGITYTPAMISALRLKIIVLRNRATRDGDTDSMILLSMIAAALQHYAENVE